MSLEQSLPRRVIRIAPIRGVRMLAGLALCAGIAALAGCATTGVAAPVVEQLSQTQYAPTQTVDVLSAPPSAPFERVARLRLSDPTGVASQAQLVAQLTDTAKTLGANALIVEQVAHAGAADLAFNPAGGQMQQASTNSGAIGVTALAIRYKP